MRNNRTMQLVGWAAVVFCGAMPVWANPLDFASYEQEVTAQFVSEAAARAATLRAAELPEGCSRVFTTRWDDSNPAHVAKAEMLAANGLRATFYLNGGSDYLRDCASRLLALGHSLGNHTQSHPHLMQLSSVDIWREILQMKIQIETQLSVPCVAYAAPFGWEQSPDAEKPAQVIRMLQASGHYVCDDGTVLRPEWDCAREAWFETFLFCADDVNPSRAIYDRQLRAVEARAAQRPEVGRLTFGIHSWCDAAGTKRQGEWLAETRRLHPDWYFGHANAFGAYRYSARFGCIRKDGVRGRTATWRVTRFDPVELGDGIPLSLVFSEQPTDCSLPKGRNGTYALAQTWPTTFRSVCPDEVAVELEVDEAAGTLSVCIVNKTDSPLSRVRVVACVPPIWREMRRMADLGTVAGRASVRQVFRLGEKAIAAGVGTCLYAASVDFVSEGQRRRGWGMWGRR